MKKRTLTAIGAALLLGACISDGMLAEQPTALVAYRQKPTEAGLLALAKTYAEAINSNKAAGVMRPGLYADYGVALAGLGCYEEAAVMFNNEAQYFPAGAAYVDTLRHALLPPRCATTRTDTSAIDLATLDTIAITYTAEEQALIDQIKADPEYQKQQKELARLEKANQALEKKAAKQQERKAKEEERKAKAEAKVRAQKEREAALKSKEKAEQAALKAEARRADSIARAEKRLQKAQEKEEKRQQELTAKKQRREQQEARKKERERKLKEFDFKYLRWLVRKGYRDDVDTNALNQDSTTLISSPNEK